MVANAMFDPQVWAAVPFHFWSVVFFVFGSIVGSFLNVCIYRMPLGLSVVSPPSHCPHCKYSIPFYLNVPLLTWLSLRGRCKNCGAPISPRYFIVELLTGLLFLACWLKLGGTSAGVALAFCLLVAGLIVATFIDFEHFIIPDEITFGGMVAGVVVTFFVPRLQHTHALGEALERSVLGGIVGAGVVYAVLRLGKLLFGRQKITLPPDSRIVFAETALYLPDQEIPYDEIFYRKTDTLVLAAKRVELVDRSYPEVTLRLALRLGRLELVLPGQPTEVLNPDAIQHLEVVASEIVIPREAMGLGDVKFMGAIGTFVGWQGTLFSLMASSVIGSVVGIVLIVLGRREWSSRMPYGPYIALAALVWVFIGDWFWKLIFP